MHNHYSKFTGKEQFTSRNKPLDLTLSSFWSWAYSELDSNIVRSVLAEYIVASALGITNLPGEDFRQMWRPYDLMFEGKRIEVKSASSIQTWNSGNKKNYTFSIAPAKVADENGNYAENAPAQRNSDAYVFCIFEPTEEDVSPLNLDMWRFLIVATREFDEKMPTQKSISIKVLESLNHIESDYTELKRNLTKVLME